jgi:hypothetical protein
MEARALRRIPLPDSVYNESIPLSSFFSSRMQFYLVALLLTASQMLTGVLAQPAGAQPGIQPVPAIEPLYTGGEGACQVSCYNEDSTTSSGILI